MDDRTAHVSKIDIFSGANRYEFFQKQKGGAGGSLENRETELAELHQNGADTCNHHL